MGEDTLPKKGSNPYICSYVWWGSEGTLNATGRSFINKTGTTQFRVYYATDDNDDGDNDYIGWHGGGRDA